MSKSKKKISRLIRMHLTLKAAGDLTFQILCELLKSGKFWAGLAAGSLIIAAFAAGIHEVKTSRLNSDENLPTVYIVYTDEQGEQHAKVTDPWEDFEHADRVEPAFDLGASDRQKVAEIIAGQAGGKSVTCQTMVANVLYNQMLKTNGNIDKTEFAKCGRGKPDDNTYEALDAIFQRGEWLLDDTVLWTGDAENPDEWHKTLRLVTTCDGIAFYEERS